MDEFKGISQESGKQKVANALSVHLAKYTPADSDALESSKEWVSYGRNHSFPDYIIRQYLSSPIHGPLCLGIAAMIAGKGIKGVPISKKDFKMLCLDLKLHGGFYTKNYPNIGGDTLTKIEHIPFNQATLQKQNEDGIIEGIVYSRNFAYPGKKLNKPQLIDASPSKPFDKWTDEEKSGYTASWGFLQTPGMTYFPKPDYISGMNYIELSKEVSEFHVNNVLNGLFYSVIISMIDGTADPVKRAALKAALEANAGAKNAGKFMILWADDKDNLPTITPFPIVDADKQYQFLADEGFKQIMFAHRVTSPLLFGIRDTGGGLGSNKDEMQQAFKLFMQQVIKPFQEIIVDTFTALGFTPEIEQNDPLFDEAVVVEPTNLISLSKEPDFTQADETIWLNHLEAAGERISLDEWDLVEESFCDSLEEPSDFRMKFSAEQKSKWGDAGLYKLRYRYSTNLTGDSRSFCKRMVSLSNEGVMYRKEDIDVMSDSGVNGKFAPEGQTSYDIFQWKGGVYCHHKWVRLIFVRKRDAAGKILPASKTSELENDKRVANNPYVPKKGDEGVAPINTPSRGSLKNG